MKGLCGLSVFFLLLLNSCEEKPVLKNENIEKKVDTTTTEESTYYNRECIYSKTDQTPSTTYPFNKTDYIEVVSYPFRRDGYSNDTLIVNEKFTVKGIEDRIRLNKEQSDSLFSLLYNYKMKRYDSSISPVDCYSPRHSILFYKNKKPFAFLEICLECGGTRQSDNINFGEFCSDKICKVHSFFKKIGVKHEITDDRCQ